LVGGSRHEFGLGSGELGAVVSAADAVLETGDFAPFVELDVGGVGVGDPPEFDILKVLGADVVLKDDIADRLAKDGLTTVADKELVKGPAHVMAVAVEKETAWVPGWALEWGGLGKAHAEGAELDIVGARSIHRVLEDGVLIVLDDVVAVTDGRGEGISQDGPFAMALKEVEQRITDCDVSVRFAGGCAGATGRERDADHQGEDKNCPGSIIPLLPQYSGIHQDPKD
jgi:hypothetical protein